MTILTSLESLLSALSEARQEKHAKALPEKPVNRPHHYRFRLLKDSHGDVGSAAWISMEAPTVRKEKPPLNKTELRSGRESLEHAIGVEPKKVQFSILVIKRAS